MKRSVLPCKLAQRSGWFTEGFDTLDLKEAKALLGGAGRLTTNFETASQFSLALGIGPWARINERTRLRTQQGRETPARNETYQVDLSILAAAHCLARHYQPGPVNGVRGESESLEKIQRRFQYGVFYIDNCSFILGLKTIMMTLFSKRS